MLLSRFVFIIMNMIRSTCLCSCKGSILKLLYYQVMMIIIIITTIMRISLFSDSGQLRATHRACSTAQVVHSSRKHVAQVEREASPPTHTDTDTDTHTNTRAHTQWLVRKLPRGEFTYQKVVTLSLFSLHSHLRKSFKAEVYISSSKDAVMLLCCVSAFKSDGDWSYQVCGLSNQSMALTMTNHLQFIPGTNKKPAALCFLEY